MNSNPLPIDTDPRILPEKAIETIIKFFFVVS
jgi:hypothetical protein